MRASLAGKVNVLTQTNERGPYPEQQIYGGWTRAMKIFYRGYMIEQAIPGLDSRVYGRLPEREELTGCPSNRSAMEWVDRVTEVEEALRTDRMAQLAML